MSGSAHLEEAHYVFTDTHIPACLLPFLGNIYIVGEKKTLRFSQDLNVGLLNSGQMLLPMSYWSSGIGAEDRWHLSIDCTVRFSGWISLRLGELCRISTEILCAATSKLSNSSSYFPGWISMSFFTIMQLCK